MIESDTSSRRPASMTRNPKELPVNNNIAKWAQKFFPHMLPQYGQACVETYLKENHPSIYEKETAHVAFVHTTSEWLRNLQYTAGPLCVPLLGVH